MGIFNMIGVFKFVCLLLPAVIGAISPPGFKVRQAVGNGGTTFPDLPQNVTAALALGWTASDKPTGPPQYSTLTLMCDPGEKTLCVHYDCYSNAAGIQISLDQRYLYDMPYDMPTEGFVNWTTAVNGSLVNFWSKSMYFIKDAANAPKVRDPSKFLQEKYIYVNDFYGEITNISTVESENTAYTTQKCVPTLGVHHFFNMTSETLCSASTLSTWFYLRRGEEFVGGGFFVTGNRTLPAGQYDLMEKWNRTDTNEAFIDAPTCFYELGDFPGYIGEKIMFIANPEDTTC